MTPDSNSMKAVATVDAPTLRAWLSDGEELALVDVREDQHTHTRPRSAGGGDPALRLLHPVAAGDGEHRRLMSAGVAHQHWTLFCARHDQLF